MARFPPPERTSTSRRTPWPGLYLDNFENLQSSWVTQGLKVGQMALLYGANDMGSLMIEENVVAEAGTVHYLSLEDIRSAIQEIGYEPRQRNVFYELVGREYEERSLRATGGLPQLPVVS